MTDPKALIPAQHMGVAKEVHHHVTVETEAVAAAVFKKAKERLRSVNDWAKITEGISADFRLCDASGSPIDRPAQQGDLVRIDIPAPDRASDSGYDWVTLETVQEGAAEDGPWTALTTRPAPDPTTPADDTAHFFDNGSTGTFIIQQKGTRVEGSHYGRNELPNTGDGSILDKARAVMITIGAYLGLSDVQWKKLIEGLLADE